MKRNISDLLDTLTPETVELDTHTPLSSRRIKELTMSKITKTHQGRRLGFRLLLIAAVIATLTVSVFAAENIMSYDNWFSDFFSGKEVVADISESQLELMESSITPINQSVTSGGYTVTLENAVTDGFLAYFTFRVDAPFWKTLDGIHYGFETVPLDVFGESNGEGDVNVRSGGWELLEDEDPTDNSVRILLQMDVNNPAYMTSALTDGQEKIITLSGLTEYYSGDISPQVIAEGDWEFTFRLSDATLLTQEVEMLSSPVRCTGWRMSGQNFFEVAVKVTSFRLRALTATLVYEKPLTGTWQGINLDAIYVVLKDGSRIRAGFSSSIPIDDTYECTYHFDVPISFADVDYVEFGGGDRAYMPQ